MGRPAPPRPTDAEKRAAAAERDRINREKEARLAAEREAERIRNLPPPPPPRPQPRTVPGAQAAKEYTGPLTTNFVTKSYITDPRDASDTCQVYYTNYVEECDAGIFSMNRTQIEYKYGKDTPGTKTVLDAASKLPEPGVCKITLDNWKLGSNSPMFNATDTTNQNRGNPENWAYCFQPLNGTNTLENIKKDIADTSSIVLEPKPIDGIYGDGISYARLAFKNFNYSTVKQDVCNKVNKNSTVPQLQGSLLGFTVDDNMIIKDVNLYKQTKTQMVVSTESQFNVYRKLFEEVVEPDPTTPGYFTLYLKNKPLGVSIYKYGKTACDTLSLIGYVPGVINLRDFAVKEWTLNSALRTTDNTYGTIANMTARRNQLNAEIQTNNTSLATTDWTCLNNVNVPLRKNTEGNVECMSTNNRDCAWQPNAQGCTRLLGTPVSPMRPLTCGTMHKQQWGGTGYDDRNHWCYTGKYNIYQDTTTSWKKFQIQELDQTISKLNDAVNNLVMQNMKSLVGKKVPYKSAPAAGEGSGISPGYRSIDGRIYILIS